MWPDVPNMNTHCERENDGVFSNFVYGGFLYKTICQGDTIPDEVVQAITEESFRLGVTSEIN
jgi:hypothetical protein